VIGNRQRRPADARRFVELARAAAERVGSVSARARAARAIGNLEVIAGNFDAADTALTTALALRQAAPLPDQVFIARLQLDLANLDSHRGHHAAAEARLRQALTGFAGELGEHHPAYGMALGNLGNTLMDLNRHDQAAEAYEQSLGILEGALGPDHPDVGQTLSNVSGVYIARGDLAGARAVLERSAAIFERIDHAHPLLASTLNNLAEVRRLQGGGNADAEALHRRALAVRRQRLGNHHPQVTQSLLSIAALVRDRGDLAAAAALCDEATGSGSPSRAIQAMIEGCHGEVDRLAGRRAQAVERFERAVELCRGAEDTGRLADAEIALARALPASASARAIELARHARTGYERERGYRKQDLAEVDAWLRRHDRSTATR
jgi:tetratricopeptide (TPR) repeat protein